MKKNKHHIYIAGLIILIILGNSACQPRKVAHATPTLAVTTTSPPTVTPRAPEGMVSQIAGDFLPGISPDMSRASGLGPDIEGDAGESLEITAGLQTAINNQGFMPIMVDQTHLNIHQDGKIGLGVTEVVADRNNPTLTYRLVQKSDGEWQLVNPGAAPQTDSQGLVSYGDKGKQLFCKHKSGVSGRPHRLHHN